MLLLLNISDTILVNMKLSSFASVILFKYGNGFLQHFFSAYDSGYLI